MKTFFIKKKITAESLTDAMVREAEGKIVEVFEDDKEPEKQVSAVGFTLEKFRGEEV